jgi:hypothetical protein
LLLLGWVRSGLPEAIVQATYEEIDAEALEHPGRLPDLGGSHIVWSDEVDGHRDGEPDEVRGVRHMLGS